MNKKLKLAALMAALPLSLSSDQAYDAPRSRRKRPVAPVVDKEPVIPGGCRWWHFDGDGNVLPSHRHHTYVFRCVAVNARNAQRKFENFKRGVV